MISDTPPNALVKCLASHPDGAVEVGPPPPINLKYSIVLPPTILSHCISLTIVTTFMFNTRILESKRLHPESGT